jgi:nucleoside-diphosphate-sugar epimerase
MLRDEPPLVFGDGKQSRDFTYVENAVSANLLAASAPKKLVAGEVFNIACGASVTLLDVIELVNGSLGKRLKPRFGPARPGDVRHSKADIRKARVLLKYAVKVPLREGLERTIDWLRTQV